MAVSRLGASANAKLLERSIGDRMLTPRSKEHSYDVMGEPP